jgi:hypothetical protein
VHFLDAWLDLSGFELGRLTALIVVCAAPVLVRGARAASLAAKILALLVPLVLLSRAPIALAAGWGLLWLAAGARFQRELAADADAPVPTGFESAAVALGLGLALVALLIAGVARQNLPPHASRVTGTAVALLGLGIMHLMLRRHASRAAFGVAAMGLGLQLLDLAAREAELDGGARPHGAVLLGTAIAVALMIRVGESRTAHSGSALVSDAHMLHD